MTTPELAPPIERDAVPAAAPLARPRNRKLGAGLLVVGGFASFMMMSQDGQLPHGPLWGLIATLVAAAGVLELFGMLRALPTDSTPNLFAAKEGESPWLAPSRAVPIALAIALVGGLALGPGHLAPPITLALLVLLLPALRRPALFVFVAASLLQLPMLGEFGLWDPWETHYGEVAREILARDDWITLWWAQDEWFRSKPVFIFWIEALSWGALGIPFGADQNPAWPEWAIRLPHYLLTMGALLASYAAMARIFSRRVAVLGALVLATTPYFFFLAHQAITDMPFVATMTIAMAFLMIALEEDSTREVETHRIGPFAVSAQNLMLGAFVVVALPQALYLISRNVTFVTDMSRFWVHVDEFVFGSAGNAGIPGNAATKLRDAYLDAIYFQPFAQGILWLAGLCALVWMLVRERRAQQLAMFGFYLFCSFAWMAKGIPGFALPGLIAAIYLFATGRWSLLLSGKLRIGAGILTIAVTGLPWYVAMFGRLGPFFTDRLFIHDHLNRLASGVHGDTGTIEYFLWQLGYGAFPWIGLAPLGFVAFMAFTTKRDGADSKERRTAMLLALWAAAAFVLFSAMITKFHHYIFPAVPPLALLIGFVLDRLLGDERDAPNERWAIALATAAPVPVILGVAGLYGDPRGIVPSSVPDSQRAAWVVQHGWPTWQCVAMVAIGLGLLGLALRILGTIGNAAVERTRAGAHLGAGMVASSMVVAFAGRDLSWNLPDRPFGHERLIHLFVYNYGRPFPDYLDYRPILTGFAVVAFAAIVIACAPKLQKAATYALIGTTFWFSAWALNVYMIDLTPHWSQRALMKRYYEERKSPNEPLVAWQMNWKGENLYTGNRVHVFVQLDNKAITKWLEQNQGKRAYFVLEHTRLAGFKRLMGKRPVQELTTLRDNNKFLLVRAEL